VNCAVPLKSFVHLMALFLHFRKQTAFVVAGLEGKIARLRRESDGESARAMAELPLEGQRR
jgi:hypothetical protein